MSANTRRLGAGALVAVATAGLMVMPTSWARGETDAAGAQLSEMGTRAFEEIAACLNAEGQLLNVLYVLDESSSLVNTDKDAARAAVLAQSIGQLGEIATSREVNMAVSTFGLNYEEKIPWTKLDAAATKRQVQWARDTVPGLNRGEATNWLDALDGGLRTMAQAPKADSACDVVIWLTDGGINVTDPGDTGADVAAMEEICGTDPLTGEAMGEPALVDAYRTANVHLIGVLLRNDSYLAELAELDPTQAALNIARMSYMRPITEGRGEVDASGFVEGGAKFDYTCGIDPIPQDQAAGALLVASDPVGLVLQFSSLASRIGGAQTTAVSNSDPQTFVIGGGIDAFDVQFADGRWELVDPEGQTIASDADTQEAGEVRVTKSSGVVTVAVRDSAVAIGTWSLKRGSQPSPAFVYVYANLNLVLTSPELFAGEETQLTVGATRSDGSPMDLSVYDSASLAVSVGSGPSDRQELSCTPSTDPSKYECPYTPTAVGDQMLRATLDTVTDSGAAFRFRGDFMLDVKPTPDFPSVAPASITLSALDGRRGVAKGILTLVGPANGSGQVCFPKTSEITITKDPLPERADNYTFGGADWGSCISIEQGQSLEVPIDIANSEAASGEVSGSIPLTLTSSRSAKELTQPVTFTFVTIRQGTPNLWIVLLLAVLGILIPVAALYLQSYLASRLRLRGLQSATVQVKVKTAGGVTRIQRASPLTADSTQLIGLSDWSYLPASVDRPRSWGAPAGVTLKGIVPGNPLGPIRATATAPTGSCIVSSEGTDNNGSQSPIGLSPVGQFYLVATRGLSSEADEFPATLVAFLSAQEADIEAASKELTVQVSVPERLARLAQVRTEETPRPKETDTSTKTNPPVPPATDDSDPFGPGGNGGSTSGSAPISPPNDDPFRER